MFSGKDLVTEYAYGNAPAIAARTSSLSTGSGVDLNDTGPEFFAFLNNGTTSGTSPTLAVKLQESNVISSDYTDISGATFTTLTAAGSEMIRVANRTKRYVRAVSTHGGTDTPTFTWSVTIFAPNKSY